MCLSSNNPYRSEYLTASNHTVTERRVEQMVKLNQIYLLQTTNQIESLAT